MHILHGYKLVRLPYYLESRRYVSSKQGTKSAELFKAETK